MNKQELSEKTGLSLRMIQFYTEQDIISCEKKKTGRGKPRKYSESKEFLEYVDGISTLHDIGMSISKIRKLKENGTLAHSIRHAEKLWHLIYYD